MKTFLCFAVVVIVIAAGCNNNPDTQLLVAGSQSETYKGPIIDMHIHAYAEGPGMFGMTHPTTLRGETYEGVKNAAEQKQKTLEKLRQHHVVKAVVTQGELWLENNEDLIWIAGEEKSVDALKTQHAQGKLKLIAEMQPFYSGKTATDPSVMPYFELAEKLNVPVGFHIFPGGPNNGIHLLPEMLGGMRVKNANPAQLDEVLIKYPKLKLYIMHGGWPYIDEVKAMLYAHANLYVDIAVVDWILPQAEFNHYVKSLVDAGFGDRILFGTDQMVWPQTIDIAVATVNAADVLTMKQKEDIFYNNAAKFLGLSAAEIAKHKAANK